MERAIALPLREEKDKNNVVVIPPSLLDAFFVLLSNGRDVRKEVFFSP